MPTLREEILELIYNAVDEINQGLPSEDRLEKHPETVLLGPERTLDSLRLVNLIVATEERVEAHFGTSVTIADERAMSRRNSPFRTIETLADYLASLVGDAGDP